MEDLELFVDNKLTWEHYMANFVVGYWKKTPATNKMHEFIEFAASEYEFSSTGGADEMAEQLNKAFSKGYD